MKSSTLVLTLVLCLSAAAFADEPSTLDVWPANPPGGKIAAEEQWQGKHVTNVSKPTLEVLRPEKDKDTGVAVLVCPGGGYKSLMMDYEGEDVARWLNTIGITGIVLKYRVPAPEGTPKYEPALQDAQRSLSLVRSKAKEWGLKEDRIGMLGFSAGGHLTAAASTNFDKRSYEAADDIDKVSCRPDFAVVIYPGGVIEKSADGKTAEGLSPEIRVSAETPPTFIAQANDDKVNSENAALLYLALKHAKVPAELHIYAKGGHGYGLRRTALPITTWPQAVEVWLHTIGVLPAHSE